MNRAREFKAKLHKRFGGLQAIGAYLADLNTDETEEAFTANPDNCGAMFRATHRLANGKPMYDARNCAEYILDAAEEEGRRYGFHTATNPTAAGDCYPLGHHTFVVLNSRYLVDIWISLYAERTTQVVFDLLDKNDHGLIEQLYGDLDQWHVWLNEQQSYQPCIQLPDNQRPRLGHHLKLVEPLEPGSL
ncbi:hypothetical protein RBE51_22300 [Pseudomonas taiwanensis]|uniref:hypothetical protein n=1 Tax=Pseudomonas taiwanensis TaxID=470150 RepID=UPI0028DF1F3B|nr:hypothetical protein [Pseudomonas taiwanensis]MDT8925519.1 hypothetical protein [Pseudomonas taiwanensis]